MVLWYATVMLSAGICVSYDTWMMKVEVCVKNTFRCGIFGKISKKKSSTEI
jgi:hypothetical protein